MTRNCMERPDIGKPFAGPGKDFRLVARTQDLAEANRIAEQYEAQGFESEIIRKKQGSLSVFEVWVAKQPDIFVAGGEKREIEET